MRARLGSDCDISSLKPDFETLTTVAGTSFPVGRILTSAVSFVGYRGSLRFSENNRLASGREAAVSSTRCFRSTNTSPSAQSRVESHKGWEGRRDVMADHPIAGGRL